MAILINNKVRENYVSGMSLNDAIAAEFGEQIAERVAENAKLANFTPVQMAMFEAGVKANDTIGRFMDAYTSSGADANEWLFPAWMETTLREAMYARSVLPYLVSNTIAIDGNLVRSPSLDLMSDKNKKAIKRARIAEGADIPVGKITIGEKAITLWKRGRGIEMTYEALRRMRIDLFRIHMNAIVSDLAQQNVDAAADVLYNGDGNDNAATELGVTNDKDTITNDELVDFLVDYYYATNMSADTLVVSKDMYKVIGHMTFDPTLSMGASSRVQFNMPQLDLTNVTVLAADVPDHKILVANRANTLIRYEENGSNIQENQRFIRNQTELMTFTENSGYAIDVAGTNRFITVKAN